jgi:hypothetical protein
MKRMTAWANDELRKIAETDDLDISPFREDGVTYGTPTWIWSVVVGAANGVLNATLGRQAVTSVPAERAAMGSGANNTGRYVGSAIGIAVVMVLVTPAGATSGAAGVVSGWNIAVLVTAGFSLLGALVVLLARERTARSEPDPSV